MGFPREEKMALSVWLCLLLLLLCFCGASVGEAQLLPQLRGHSQDWREYVLDCSAQSNISCVCGAPVFSQRELLQHVYVDCGAWLTEMHLLPVHNNRTGWCSFWRSYLHVELSCVGESCLAVLTPQLPDAFAIYLLWVSYLILLLPLNSMMRSGFQSRLDTWPDSQRRLYPGLYAQVRTLDAALAGLYLLGALWVLALASGLLPLDCEADARLKEATCVMASRLTLAITSLYLVTSFLAILVLHKSKTD